MGGLVGLSMFCLFWPFRVLLMDGLIGLSVFCLCVSRFAFSCFADGWVDLPFRVLLTGGLIGLFVFCVWVG